MKVAETINRNFAAETEAYTHYELPSPLTVEGIKEALKDQPKLFKFLSFMYDVLIAAPQHFDNAVGIAKRMLDEREAKTVAELRASLPKKFLKSLPKKSHGFTQDQPGYWLEPDANPVRPEAPIYLFTVGSDNYSMAPRFLPCTVIEMEEVFEDDPITPGALYFAPGHGQGRTLNVGLGWKGERINLTFDADPRPADCPERYYEDGIALHWGSTAYRPEGFQLFRFVGYADAGRRIAEQATVAPGTVIKRHDWAEIKQRYAKYEADRLAKNAKSRERYARKKQQSNAQQPMPLAVLWPSRGSSQRAHA